MNLRFNFSLKAKYSKETSRELKRSASIEEWLLNGNDLSDVTGAVGAKDNKFYNDFQLVWNNFDFVLKFQCCSHLSDIFILFPFLHVKMEEFTIFVKLRIF